MDWIKVEAHLSKKTEIIQLEAELDISNPEAVGACVIFWSWADAETPDGHLPNCSESMVDRIVGLQGFAAGLIRVGWLLKDDCGLVIPNFDRHQGSSAKKRALGAVRQSNWRNRSRGNGQ